MFNYDCVPITLQILHYNNFFLNMVIPYITYAVVPNNPREIVFFVPYRAVNGRGFAMLEIILRK